MVLHIALSTSIVLMPNVYVQHITVPPHSNLSVRFPLDQDSQYLTAFITEWGRFMYKRIPQGFIAAGDIYTRQYDEIIKDIPQKVKCVDDTLLYDNSIEQAFYHTWDYLYLCTSNSIIINNQKFKFCKKTVTFAGLNITPSGITPSSNTMSAIRDFPVP